MNLENSKYVLYFRFAGEAMNTAHCALVDSVFAAGQHLIQFHEQDIVWANLINDSGVIVREFKHLL